MTLKDLFCASLSRTILMYYWEEITKGLYVLNIDTGSCEKLIDNIRANFPIKRPNTILALMGFVQTCQQIGIRSKKLLLGLNDSQFDRLKADAKKLEQGTKSPRFAMLGAVKKN